MKLLKLLLPVLAVPALLSAESQDLFNGKNLKGWVIENNGQFEVSDGILHLNRGLGWLRSVDTFGDFTLTLEVRFLEEDANSGIFIRTLSRSKDDEAGYPANGYQIQCRDTVEGEYPIGAMINFDGSKTEDVVDVEAIKQAYRPTGEWNRFIIHAEEDLVTVILNGIVVTRSQGVGNSPGHIGIQGENGLLEFRRIEVIQHNDS